MFNENEKKVSALDMENPMNFHKAILASTVVTSRIGGQQIRSMIEVHVFGMYPPLVFFDNDKVNKLKQ